MLLVLRRLKQNYFNNTEFRKYLLYALGEMALVIIGILIALQIDNWNNERIQQESLDNYLRAISRNIGSDLVSMNEIRSRRMRDYELSVRWLTFERRGKSYTVPEAVFAGELIGRASTLSQFNASNSGYEALKASGTLDQLQGTDLERLLYDYYDTVARIAAQEQGYNDVSRLLSLQVWAVWPEDFASWELISAFALTEDRFESQQDNYRRVLENSTTEQFLAIPAAVGPLLLEYDRLDHLGSIFRTMVEDDRVNFDAAEKTTLDGIHDPSKGVGQPNLITDGQVAWHSHHVIASDADDPRISYAAAAAGLPSPYDFNSFRRTGDSLRIDSKGRAEWAGVWFPAGTGVADRLSPDYSMYDTLVLELKGDVGGERIVVNMEDREDPADGSSTRYPLQLSDQWETYEIDLEVFETADLSILSVPLGFIFFDEPVSFAVRNARFVKSD
jgi:hypothetical protein